MDFDEYQKIANTTATFDGNQEVHKLMFITLGVVGESGEIAEKIKKIVRNNDGAVSTEDRESLKNEIGDVLWYLSQLSRVLGFKFSEAAAANLSKIQDRKARDVIKSTGDNR